MLFVVYYVFVFICVWGIASDKWELPIICALPTYLSSPNTPSKSQLKTNPKSPQETSPLICVNPVDVRVRRTGTVGQLIGDADVRVVKDGQEVAPEEEGEIWVAGPFVFKVRGCGKVKGSRRGSRPTPTTTHISKKIIKMNRIGQPTNHT
jgi:hypothetical protein